MKSIDLIIPVFNSQKYLDNALKSIETQSIKNLLLITIVIDGGNTNYEKILEKYQKNLDIKVMGYKKNKGVGYARNYAIKHTSLPLITFFDSDDKFYNKFSLEKLYNEINGKSYIMVGGQQLKNGKKYYNDAHLHGKIYRRNALKKYNINFLNIRISEDVSFSLLLEILYNKDKIKIINDIVYIWNRDNRNSLTYDQKTYVDDNYFKCCYRAAKYSKRFKKTEKFYNQLPNILIHLHNEYIRYNKSTNIDDLTIFIKNCSIFYKKYYSIFNTIEISKYSKEKLNLNQIKSLNEFIKIIT
jgi:glycosyltransferase involved in cell wall biosynthesis